MPPIFGRKAARVKRGLGQQVYQTGPDLQSCIEMRQPATSPYSAVIIG
jgi:hypothetical protein